MPLRSASVLAVRSVRAPDPPNGARVIARGELHANDGGNHWIVLAADAADEPLGVWIWWPRGDRGAWQRLLDSGQRALVLGLAVRALDGKLAPIQAAARDYHAACLASMKMTREEHAQDRGATRERAFVALGNAGYDTIEVEEETPR